ncbi:hypothetical protein DL766_010620 [Monosporascus sp. MC13-8B]|uniref:Uncharacterized protein n=1 Tax=Monosporascus cannonballus TaxID=155416 RepID=A0ABY0H666_9PEZI|nr:hypothetical protein DL762_006161 [Monosporascus cannonballus]RYO90968.1 hypothetical protein DL763_005139 [Monosporascus cannonballus]RYP01979.1 hypothetical protein DL766_010620 [Monosporascus sp. MC13-8B]
MYATRLRSAQTRQHSPGDGRDEQGTCRPAPLAHVVAEEEDSREVGDGNPEKDILAEEENGQPPSTLRSRSSPDRSPAFYFSAHSPTSYAPHEEVATRHRRLYLQARLQGRSPVGRVTREPGRAPTNEVAREVLASRLRRPRVPDSGRMHYIPGSGFL